MKVVMIVRALNEADIIERCIEAYLDIADVVIVGDGGSTDDTVKKCLAFPSDRVKVRHFTKKHTLKIPEGDDGESVRKQWMNPESEHINWLQSIAIEEENPDWILMDDADCWPNPALRRDGRDILQIAYNSGRKAVFLYRLYCWGFDSFFPKYSAGGMSLWAWRPDLINVVYDESKPTFFEVGHPVIGYENNILLEPPYVCLHYAYRNADATYEKKKERYKAWGARLVHPQHGIYAPNVPLPAWAVLLDEGHLMHAEWIVHKDWMEKRIRRFETSEPVRLREFGFFKYRCQFYVAGWNTIPAPSSRNDANNTDELSNSDKRGSRPSFKKG